MKKRASFIVVLPTLILSCGVREEPKAHPGNPPTNVVAVPLTIEATQPPDSTGAVVQPTSTPTQPKDPLNIDDKQRPIVNPPELKPEMIVPTANPPAITKPKSEPKPIHKNPPSPGSGDPF